MSEKIIPFYSLRPKSLLKGKACKVYDNDGKEYIDFESGDWAVNLGHSRDEITNIITLQASKIMHDGLTHANSIAENLSTLLLEKLGMGLGQSTFLNSGSEAVNLGITLARKITGRTKVLKMDCSYLSAFGYGNSSSENSDLLSVEMNNVNALEEIDYSEIAVFVLEAGNAWGLVKFPNRKFVEEIAKRAREYGTLLMANEVTVGFGRTGKWFGFQHYNYQPDIVSVGKAMGNGYPISGVVINEKAAKLFKEKPFRYAQSHQNDSLGCAVACEVIKVLEEEDLIAASKEKGDYFINELRILAAKYPNTIVDVRERGLMLAIELKDEGVVEHTVARIYNKGFIIGSKEKVIRFMPPLIVGKQEIDKVIVALEEAIGLLV